MRPARAASPPGHDFVLDADVAPDHRGTRWCTCGLPEPRHSTPTPAALPDTPDAAREIDARRLGEPRED